MVLLREEVNEALDELVRRYKRKVLTYLTRFLNDVDEAHDIAQEVFIRVYRHRANFDETQRFSTWFFTIASNLARNEAKRRSRFSFLRIGTDDDLEKPSIEPVSQDPTPSERLDLTLKLEMVQQELAKLPAIYREAVILRDLQQLSYNEIVQATGASLEAVKTRINRGRTLLQKALKACFDED